MRLLGLDFETTGLDLKEDRITEIGAALWDTDLNRPLVTFGVFVIDDGVRARMTPETVDMMKRICGITPEMLDEFGLSPKDNLEWLTKFSVRHGVSHVVAHNGRNFDKPLLANELARHGLGDYLISVPWIDTRSDIPHPTPPDSHKLKHLALDAGFINPFAHRAVFDVLTMLRVLSQHDINEVVRYSQIPSVVVRAMVPHPKLDGGKGKDTAKAVGYRWQEVDYKIYEACWVKKIKEDQLEAEQKRLPNYKVVVIDRVPVG